MPKNPINPNKFKQNLEKFPKKMTDKKGTNQSGLSKTPNAKPTAHKTTKEEKKNEMEEDVLCYLS